MKIIMTKNPYGFGRDWTLEYKGNKYFLGQDQKVCSRLLGINPSDVINEIHERTGLSIEEARMVMDNIEANECLAEIIVEAHGLTGNEKIEPWSLAVE